VTQLLAAALFVWVLIAGSAPGAAPASESWKQLPVVPDMSGPVARTFKRDLERADQRSMRPRVFAKVGDSNTEMAPALYGLACRRPRLDGRPGLAAVIDRYNQVKLPNPNALPGCSPSTSFSRRSASVRSGTWSTWSLITDSDLPPDHPLWSPPTDCRMTESPLECEIRTIRPRYTIIMTGTNDLLLNEFLKADSEKQLEYNTGQLIEEVRRLGSVPVVSTLAPVLTGSLPPGDLEKANAGITTAALRHRVPIINLWRALTAKGMINSGMEPGGLHLRAMTGGAAVPPVPRPNTFVKSVDFRRAALRFGSNRRNLVWLQTLAALDRAAGSLPGDRSR